MKRPSTFGLEPSLLRLLPHTKRKLFTHIQTVFFKEAADDDPDKQLTYWLKDQGADPDTVERVRHAFLSGIPMGSIMFWYMCGCGIVICKWFCCDCAVVYG